jgi:transposase
LRLQRYEHPHPRVQKKMEALYLKGIELPNRQICKILNIINNTLLKYFRQYMEGGIEGLKEVKFYRSQSNLKKFSGTIAPYFLEHPPRSIREASAKIKEMTGMDRKETQVREFFKSLEFRFMKVRSIPAKALTKGGKTSGKFFWKKTSNLK